MSAKFKYMLALFNNMLNKFGSKISVPRVEIPEQLTIKFTKIIVCLAGSPLVMPNSS